MTYKLLLVRNRFTKKLDFKKCFDWFSKNLDISMTMEEISTDFEVTTVPIGNSTYKGVVAGNIVEPLKTVVPEGKYHAVIFVYGNEMNGIRLNCVNGLNSRECLYLNTEIIQLVNTDWKTLNHELFHAFFGKANRFGANIIDNMDSYYRDKVLDLDEGETNRTVAVKSLAPHWNVITSLTNVDTGCKPGYAYSSTTGLKCPLQGSVGPVNSILPLVTITRQGNDKETLGSLIATIGGAVFNCKTLELPWKNNQQNISCIPTGTYKCMFTRSLKFPMGTYQVINVTGRSGIRFHKGNYAYKTNGKPDIEGCILLGVSFADINNDGINDIVQSTVTVQAFERFFDRKDFTLVIK